jgi:succinate dehydrogenase / fumarate reductase cytochrome b subunit
MARFAYYPGCATHGLAKDVDIATKKVAEVLGIDLVEIPDWSCCGGGFLDEYDEISHISINLRNLSKVEKMGLEKMVTPCSVCLHSHRLASYRFKEEENLRKEVTKRLTSANIKYEGKASAEHIVWILVKDVGIETIKKYVKRPLSGLKVAAYYGCQILRPEQIMGFEKAYKPRSVESLIEAVGATPITFPQATTCCGFPLMGSNPKGGLKLAYNVLKGAKDNGADILVHPCSLCHLQVDITQYKIKSEFNVPWVMPAIYITQLIGLAFGFSINELRIGKFAAEVLKMKGIE